MASGAERRTKRHTGGVRISKLGAFQRRLLQALLDETWRRSKEQGRTFDDVWLPWTPSKRPPQGFEATDAPALSKAVTALEKRRLVHARRHDGGKVYAVRLSGPGVNIAIELTNGGGRTIDQRREDLAEQLPREIRSAVPLAYRELRTPGVPEDRRAVLERFVHLYALWTSDLDDPGGGIGMPGITATPAVLEELLAVHRSLTSWRFPSGEPEE